MLITNFGFKAQTHILSYATNLPGTSVPTLISKGKSNRTTFVALIGDLPSADWTCTI